MPDKSPPAELFHQMNITRNTSPQRSLWSETIASGQSHERRLKRIRTGFVVSTLLAVIALWKALF
jgi:heme/copper-type cytochrome/quinol oxidase subunit 4